MKTLLYNFSEHAIDGTKVAAVEMLLRIFYGYSFLGDVLLIRKSFVGKFYSTALNTKYQQNVVETPGKLLRGTFSTLY